MFAEVYATKYSGAVLELMWNELIAYRDGTYIAPKVISGVLKYFQNALEPAQTWQMVMPLVPELTATIIFPMMCFNDEDAELWEADPREYVPCLQIWNLRPSPFLVGGVGLLCSV